jgi:hypothetical protein
MGKRGLTHIEMVMSFVIFVGFLVMALYFFNPIKVDRLLSSSAYYAEDEIIKRLNTEVESYSVVLLEPINRGVSEVEISNNGKKVRAEYYNGTRMDASYIDGRVVFNNPGGRDFIRIMFSDDFEESQIQRGVQASHKIASFDKRNVLSERKALELNASYHDSYHDLKREFNLPGRIDFSFSIKFNDLEINAEREIPQDIEVFVRERRVEIIRASDGRMDFADLVVKIW